ncbi:hypothetical protein Efla_006470 [Eimeria flavescens]
MWLSRRRQTPGACSPPSDGNVPMYHMTGNRFCFVYTVSARKKSRKNIPCERGTQGGWAEHQASLRPQPLSFVVNNKQQNLHDQADHRTHEPDDHSLRERSSRSIARQSSQQHRALNGEPLKHCNLHPLPSNAFRHSDHWGGTPQVEAEDEVVDGWNYRTKGDSSSSSASYRLQAFDAAVKGRPVTAEESEEKPQQGVDGHAAFK